MTKESISALGQELWVLQNRGRIRVVKIRLNHDIYMYFLANHNALFNVDIPKDDPRITFQGIPLERTRDVETWEIVPLK